MKFETEGIVLKQIKTVGGRRMIVLLSARYGKISAGSGINEGFYLRQIPDIQKQRHI